VTLDHVVSLIALCTFVFLPLVLFQDRVELVHKLSKKRLQRVLVLAVLALFLWQPKHDDGCMAYLNHSSSFFGASGTAEDCHNFLGLTMGHTIGRLRFTVASHRLFGSGPLTSGQKTSLDLTPEVASLLVAFGGLAIVGKGKSEEERA
jgi:hypothetical protein